MLKVRPQNLTVNPFNLFVEEWFQCRGTSDCGIPPAISWYRLTNGTATQVNTSASDRLVVDGDGSLIFRGIPKTEWIQFAGWYRCVADDGYTSDSAEAFLNVLTSRPVPTSREFPIHLYHSVRVQGKGAYT